MLPSYHVLLTVGHSGKPGARKYGAGVPPERAVEEDPPKSVAGPCTRRTCIPCREVTMGLPQGPLSRLGQEPGPSPHAVLPRQPLHGTSQADAPGGDVRPLTSVAPEMSVSRPLRGPAKPTSGASIACYLHTPHPTLRVRRASLGPRRLRGNDGKQYVRGMICVVVDGLGAPHHIGSRVRVYAGVQVSVETGEVAARNLDPNPATR